MTQIIDDIVKLLNSVIPTASLHQKTWYMTHNQKLTMARFKLVFILKPKMLFKKESCKIVSGHPYLHFLACFYFQRRNIDQINRPNFFLLLCIPFLPLYQYFPPRICSLTHFFRVHTLFPSILFLQLNCSDPMALILFIC